MNTLKNALYERCMTYVNQRVENAQIALNAAQHSANSETKSTAGDKHDTARSMMQLEVEQNAKQLEAANQLLRILKGINPDATYTTVQSGSLVKTSNGNFFVAISAGKIDLDGEVYFAAAPSSPLIQALQGLKAGDKTSFNSNTISVLEVS